MKIDIQIHRLNDLQPLLLHAMYRLRQNIFIVEQEGICEDIDEYDINAWHTLVIAPDAHVVGCCRLSEQNSNNWRIQRVAVDHAWRRQGIAHRMLLETIEHAQRLGALGIALNAQLHAKSVYDRLGFIAVSDVYDDAGDPHIAMSLTLRCE